MTTANISQSFQSLPNLSIELARGESDTDWQVKTVTLRTSVGVVRHIFKELSSLAEALNGQLAAFLSQKLETLAPRGILALQDAFPLTDGTTLLKFRFMSTGVFEGMARATVNVFQVIGSMASLFSPRYRQTLGIEDTSQRVAAKALVDLINPCLDLLRSPLNTQQGEVQVKIEQRLNKLAEVQNELTFWSGLLTRYATAQTHESATMPDAQTHRRRLQ